jgi:hypothetical protein
VRLLLVVVGEGGGKEPVRREEQDICGLLLVGGMDVLSWLLYAAVCARGGGADFGFAGAVVLGWGKRETGQHRQLLLALFMGDGKEGRGGGRGWKTRWVVWVLGVGGITGMGRCVCACAPDGQGRLASRGRAWLVCLAPLYA